MRYGADEMIVTALQRRKLLRRGKTRNSKKIYHRFSTIAVNISIVHPAFGLDASWSGLIGQSGQVKCITTKYDYTQVHAPDPAKLL